MKTTSQSKQGQKPLGFLISISLACFTLLPNARAVNPPPIGGYPGGNTAEGQSALLNLTTGAYNAGIGIFSLLENATGNFNTGVGAGTLLSNTADENTATGAGALLSNTTGGSNTASEAFALFSIPRAAKARPMVLRHSLVTPPAVTTRLSATARFLLIRPEAIIRLLVTTRSFRIPAT